MSSRIHSEELSDSLFVSVLICVSKHCSDTIWSSSQYKLYGAISATKRIFQYACLPLWNKIITAEVEGMCDLYGLKLVLLLTYV